jgi:hypothetical protein
MILPRFKSLFMICLRLRLLNEDDGRLDMYEVARHGKSVWKELKQGSIGLTVWVLRSNSECLGVISNCLAAADNPKELARAVLPGVKLATNCICQLGLHQIAGEGSTQPCLEPLDGRWSVLNLLPSSSAVEVAQCVAEYADFSCALRDARSEIVQEIRNSRFHSQGDLARYDSIAAAIQLMLSLTAVALIDAFAAQEQTFLALLGHVARRNAEEQSIYSFQRTPPGQSYNAAGAAAYRRRYAN